MAERIIKIFMASSDELEGDRAIFGNLIRRLNDMYKRHGIYIELFQWEDFDAAYNGRRKQGEYNDKVRESDLFLAFFYRKAGEFTIEEFDVAIDGFNNNAQPKVYTYMRDLAPDDWEEDSLITFKERLYREMGHYWCRYGNADTMKLHFVLQFQQMEENHKITQIEVKDSTVKLDGEPIANLKNIPFAANNKDFQKMTERVVKLNEKVTRYREKMKEDSDNADYLEELREAIKELDEVSKELEQHETFLFNIAKTFAQQSGKACTERMLRARELFEQGKAAEANGILDTEDITRDIAASERRYEQSKALMEESRKNILKNIEELLLKTQTTMADSTIPVPERFSQACAAYEQAIALQRKYSVSEEDFVNTLFDYAILLSEFNHFKEELPLLEECLEIFKKLTDIDPDTHLYNLAIVLHKLANLHGITNRYDEAEKEYKEALEIFHRGEPPLLPEIALIDNNLANLYKNNTRYRDAEMGYNNALEIRRKLATANPDVYLPDVAATLDNLANLYKDIDQCYGAETDYVEALKIRRKLAAANPDAYLPDVADTLYHQANLYSAINLYDKAESIYVEALEIYRGFAVTIPDVFLPKVANTLNNLAYLHSEYNRCEEAEKEYAEALGIYSNVADTVHKRAIMESWSNRFFDPRNYHHDDWEDLEDLEDRWAEAGGLEEDPYELIDFLRAEKIYTQTLEISRKLATTNPSTYLPDVADTLNNLANLHRDYNRYDKAEKECAEVLEISRKLANANPNAYLPKMADILRHLAGIHYHQSRFDESKFDEFVKESAEATKIFGQIHYEELVELKGKMEQIDAI